MIRTPTPETAADAIQYAEYRNDLVAATTLRVYQIAVALSVIYALLQWLVRPAQFLAMAPVYLVQVVIPVVAWGLVCTRLRRHAEWVALGMDLAYTACLSAQLFAPETNSSGSVTFLCLKMMTTAVLFPWRARLQYLSATATVLMYYLCFFLAHRTDYEVLYLYHYFGPPEAALLSMLGARFADQARGRLFRQGAERQELLARQRMILEHMPVGCIMTDAQFRSTYWNPAAEALFHYRADAVIGRSLTEVIGPAVPHAVPPDHLPALAAESTPQTIRAEHRTGDGRVVVCEWVRTDLRDQHEALIGVLAMCQDVTAEQRSEDERRLLFDKLRAANRLKSDFVATMSHELRTPLHVILGYQGLLQEGRFGPLNADQSAVLERIGRSGHELLELIGATLDVSRIESGSVKVERRRVHLYEIARQVDTETRELHTNPKIRVEWHIEPSLPPVDTDPAKFKVVLKNLFNNALKFTDAGSVVVTAAEQDGGVEVRVTDTGIGIAGEALPIIFEPFRQAADVPTRRHGGVGLGLYIVHRLVGMLGARIHVESEPGRGTCFRVWVPLASTNGASA